MVGRTQKILFIQLFKRKGSETRKSSRDVEFTPNRTLKVVSNEKQDDS